MHGASDDADIAVVGAGPAGAWLARQLAVAGARVLLFDASHPREKACGGGVTGRALDEIAPDVPLDTLDAVPIARASFRAAGVPDAHVALEPEVGRRRRLVVVDRRSFDAALLGAAVAAGARHVAERVNDVHVAPGGVLVRTGRTLYRAGRVAGADGVTSLVRRRTGRPFAREDLSIASGYFAFGATLPEIHVEFFTRPPGYLWAFPRRDHLALGACSQADAVRPDALDTLVAGRLRDLVPAHSRLVPYRWPIPSLSTSALEREHPAGDRWLLVGDAAGLVDPITREGIYFAIRSASLASQALLGDSRASQRYVAALHREIYPELRRAARLKRGFFASAFTRLLVEALRQSGPVREVMADLVAGEQAYRSLKRRLLATFEVRLAWRLLLLEMGMTSDALSRAATAPRTLHGHGP